MPSGVQCGAEIGQPGGLVHTNEAEGMPGQSMCPPELPHEAFLPAAQLSQPHFVVCKLEYVVLSSTDY